MTKYFIILTALVLMIGCDNGDPKSPIDDTVVKDDTAVTDDVADSEQPDEIADTDTATENTVVADDAEPDGKPDLDVPATCGNGVIDSGEICDGGSVYCGDLDEKWAFGTAYCNDTCSGYDTYECQEPYADDDDTADPDEDEATDEEAEDDNVIPDSDEQIDEDSVDIQPDPDMVDEDTYDDWVPDTADVQPDLDMVDEDLVDEDTVDVDIAPDADTVVSGVLCTGQTKCYDNTAEMTCPTAGNDFYGQDSQYASLGCCTPRDYTVSGTTPNDIVTDNVTGLIWQRTLPATYDGCTGESGTKCTWQEAIDYCDGLTYAGYTDWRLPSRKELATLPEYGRDDPAIDTTIFPGTQSDWHWASSSSAGSTGSAWFVHFSLAVEVFQDKASTYYARCVRGDTLSNSAFTEETVSGKIIVTDTVTGLIWTKEYSGTVTWENALSHCESLNYGGYTDWRLPNIEELKTLLDDTIYSPASTFPEMPSSSFWSSSSLLFSNDNAWFVSFNNGAVSFDPKTNINRHATRCVR